MTLIERIHQNHERRGLVDLTCLLCREAQEKARKSRPVWIGHPRVFDPRPAA